jgi:hypothetical protein
VCISAIPKPLGEGVPRHLHEEQVEWIAHSDRQIREEPLIADIL